MDRNYVEKATAIIIHRIEMELARGRERFILYPFGAMGRYIKDILNTDFQIQELFCLDNKVRAEGVFSLDFLKSHILEDEYIILTSGKEDIYFELRQELKKYVSERNIIDIFEKENKNTEYLREQIENNVYVKERYTEYLRKQIEDNVYVMKRYNVKFYLPFWERDYIQQTIIANGDYYESEYLYYVTKVFRGGIDLQEKVVLDIGANIGNHSIYFAKECGAGKVISFEPVEETFNILKRNIEINRLETCIFPNNFGIGESHSHASISRYTPYNIGMTSLREMADGNIEIYFIDELDLSEDVAFIKIDVEGFEVKVIKGALQLIERCMPVMMIESNEEDGTICDIIKLLCPMGYNYQQVNKANYIFYVEA